MTIFYHTRLLIAQYSAPGGPSTRPYQGVARPLQAGLSRRGPPRRTEPRLLAHSVVRALPRTLHQAQRAGAPDPLRLQPVSPPRALPCPAFVPPSVRL